MNKPDITLNKIMYKPDHKEDAEEYPVYLIGEVYTSWSQMYIYCTGCGRGHHYRRSTDDSLWWIYKCPHCETVSAHFEEFEEEEEEDDE